MMITINDMSLTVLDQLSILELIWGTGFNDALPNKGLELTFQGGITWLK